MIIKNKLESIAKIKELNLNTFPEQLFKKNEEDKVLEFINKYPAKYYAIRDKSKVGGIFKLKVKKENILEEIKDYDLYTINVSSYNYKDNQIYEADIELTKSGNIYLTISFSSETNVRDNIKDNFITLKTNILNDRELNKIPYIDTILKYIYDNNLIDVMVELSLFDIPLGINNEKIIVWELRTHY